MNNTICNAFSHLARLRDAHHMEQIRAEGQRAIDHIERANRDCLKAAIIQAHAALEELILDTTFHHGRLTPALDGQLNRLREERKTEEIKTQYPETGSRLTRLQRVMKRWHHPLPLGYVVSAVIGTVVGCILIKPYLQPLLDRFF
ncbi:MAG: hypothetical protein HQL86_09715 [Magnetococcales bacterium]|nr:hypothetical protein [Magnetococcales bacterium]